MTRLPDGKTRLDLVREGLGADAGVPKRGRLVVSLDKLREDPHNERKTFRNMEGLIASVKAVGLIEPITVTPDAQGLYQIITGHRRYRAALAAGLAQVEVLIREPEDELKRRQKSIISNVQREDIGPVEMAEALQALIEEDPRVSSQEDLARMIGKDKAWVSGMLRILTLPTALQEKVGSTQLSVGYDAIIRIARLDDPRLQAELIEMLLQGASQADIRERIGQAKGRSRTSRPKPKRAFRTNYKAVVIVQAMTGRLTDDQCIAALADALDRAKGGGGHDEDN
jgi:ParB family chromosome partitioning protein